MSRPLVNSRMRYRDIIPTPLNLFERRFAIQAHDLNRAVWWFEHDVALGRGVWPIVRSKVVAAVFASSSDAARFAEGAFGRSRWRSVDETVVYLASGGSVEIDLAAEIEFARNRINQLGLTGRGEIIDGLTIDCLFRSPELAGAFADALNAADVSLPQHGDRAVLTIKACQ